ncbi:MAG: DUF3530 family protein [Methylobacter sp.]|nr:DUF3530 family protein [Methylobacter sp.]MDP2426707.1 DUF3530 family protein [Methylobacter sp.]MDP3054743.1 DUF3530 family protein [Methylobacter sp.]MDP3361795.1 DUF3530 family protein [Methylobacter sp.]MDZ4219540.1 DUF3530 family protein [Methylobacter sp.]
MSEYIQPGFMVFMLCLMPLLGGVCLAGDTKREAEFADSINKTLAIGEEVWLEAEGKKFLGLFTPTEKIDSKGIAIIVHEMGGHPNQKQLIYGLRVALPEHNWATLALQMPLREAGAGQEDYYPLFAEAAARIQAGISYARDSGTENIVLVGYGLGSLMGVYALSEQGLAVKALATISLSVPKTDNNVAQTLDFIQKITIPMLDIYGALDLPEVVQSARDRRVAAKQNVGYRQVKINDQDHVYLHDEGLLVKRIYSWLGVVVD